MDKRSAEMPHAVLSKTLLFYLVSLAPVALTVLLLNRNVCQASPGTFTVNSTADAVDVSPGDGVCATAAGDCTLRAAIQETNALAGADTINLPAGTYRLSIPGGEDAAAAGDLDIVGDLTIGGAGVTDTIVDAAGLVDRVLHVLSGTVNISGLTIQNGRFTADGGGVFNKGVLTLSDTAVTGNQGNHGGGIYNSATLTLSRSTVSRNGASWGGGIFNFFGGQVTLNNSTVYGNSSGSRGGGMANFGSISVNGSTVSDNSTFGDGGGIYTDSGTVSLNNSTASANSANRGGGIFKDFSGGAAVANSTVSGNSASVGGGIYAYGHMGGVRLKSSTVSSNTATRGGGVLAVGSTPSLTNTILANSTAAGDCDGTIGSGGHNLIEDTSGCTIVGNTTGNITGADPLLGPLADNGGPTQTHALYAGSPAIDAGDNAACPATDQRGTARPQGSVCDIGAFELEQPPTPTPTDTPTGTPTNTPTHTVTATNTATRTATPTPARAVGGIVGLPAQAGISPAESAVPGEGSGGPAAVYAPLAGAVVAAAMALGGGAWYARRRRIS